MVPQGHLFVDGRDRRVQDDFGNIAEPVIVDGVAPYRKKFRAIVVHRPDLRVELAGLFHAVDGDKRIVCRAIGIEFDIRNKRQASTRKIAGVAPLAGVC